MSYSEWKEHVLEDLVEEVTVGYVGTMTNEYVDTGIPFLRSMNIEPHFVNSKDIKYITKEFNTKLKKSMLRPNDVVVVRTGKPGTCAVIPAYFVEGNCSDLIIIRTGPMVDPYFLSYYINTIATGHIGAHLVGAVQQHYNVGSAKKMKVYLPSNIKEQKAVSKIVKDLNEKIEINNRINKTLEDMAQEIFKRWFVDFEFPNENGDPYKYSGGEMVESELGMIPKGWEVKGIGDLCTITSSKRIFMNEYVTEGIPFYRGKEIIEKSNGSVISTELYITIDKYNEIKEKFSVPMEGDILLTSVGTLGVPYKVDGEKFYFKDGNLTWFKDYIKKGYSNYLYLWLLSVEGKMSLESITIGSTQKALTIASLKKLKLVVCDDSILTNFEQIISSLIDRIYCNNKEKACLIKLRDAVLPKLMSGEISVPIAATE